MSAHVYAATRGARASLRAPRPADPPVHLSVDGERTLCGLDLRTMYERSDMSDAAALELPRAWEAGNRCRRCVDSGLRGGHLDA